MEFRKCQLVANIFTTLPPPPPPTLPQPADGPNCGWNDGSHWSQKSETFKNIPRYPDISPVILENIAIVLLKNCAFYHQVCDLMGRMGFAAPFGPVREQLPYCIGSGSCSRCHDSNRAHVREEESEMEDSDEEDFRSKWCYNIPSNPSLVTEKLKSILRSIKATNRRKWSSAASAGGEKAPKSPRIQPTSLGSESRAFDADFCDHGSNLDFSKTKSLTIKIKDVEEVPGKTDRNVKIFPANENGGETSMVSDELTENVVEIIDDGGFGKVGPPVPTAVYGLERSEVKSYSFDQLIPLRRLKSGCFSKSEQSRLKVFRNYSPGPPSCRLYVKNIDKSVTEQDLVDIFGNFVDLSNSIELEWFDVKLLTRGRMRGQAFVHLVSVENATRAVEATNGYILKDRPIVVLFARTKVE